MRRQIQWSAIVLSALCVGCEVEFQFDPGTPLPDPEVLAVEVGELDLCPPHTRGDRDFRGHGPCVDLTAEVAVDTDDNTLDVRVHMDAEEWEDGQPKSDYTTARGRTRWHSIRMPDGVRIVGLAPGQEATFRHTYLDDDHEDDAFWFSASRLVDSLVYTGDTYGDDAGVATGVSVCFNRVEVLVVED